jgi:hypothetical protein
MDVKTIVARLHKYSSCDASLAAFANRICNMRLTGYTHSLPCSGLGRAK